MAKLRGGSTVYGNLIINGNAGIGTSSPTSGIHIVPGSSSIAGLFSGTTSADMIRITQTGAGNALVVIPGSGSIAGLFSGTTSADIVRITQLGSGNAFVVEDSTNPDATPVVIDSVGDVGIGTNDPTAYLTLGSGTATAGDAPLKFLSGTVLGTAEVGAVEYDGSFLYHTPNSTSGRAYIPPTYTFRRTGAGRAIGATIADFFTTPSSLSLEASSVYIIRCFAYFTKTTAGTATWTQTFSSAPTIAEGYHWATPVTGMTAATSASITQLENYFYNQGATTYAWLQSATTLTTAVNHWYRLNMTVVTNAATNWRLRLTQSAGTATPLAGSFYTIEKVSTSTGTFAA